MVTIVEVTVRSTEMLVLRELCEHEKSAGRKRIMMTMTLRLNVGVYLLKSVISSLETLLPRDSSVRSAV